MAGSSLSFLFRKITLRRLREYWRRHLLIALIIALGITLSLGVLDASNRAVQSFSSSTETLQGRGDYELRRTGAPQSLNELSPFFEKLLPFAAVNPALEVPVTLIGLGEKKILTSVMGVDLLSLLLESNDKPEKILHVYLNEGNFAALGYNDATKVGLKKIMVRGALAEARLLEIEKLPQGSLAVLPVIDITVASSLITSDGKIYATTLTLKNRTPKSSAQTKKIIANFIEDNPSWNLVTPLSEKKDSENLFFAFRLNIFILVGVTFLVTLLTILNCVELGTLSFTRELSILHSLGVSTLTLIFLILAEVILAASFGTVLGLTVGAPLSNQIAAMLSQSVNQVYLQQETFTSLSFGQNLQLRVIVIIIGFFSALLGAVIPAIKRVQSSTPALSLKSIKVTSNQHLYVFKQSIFTLLLGSTSLLTGLYSFYQDSLLAAYLSAILTMLSAIFLAPLLVQVLFAKYVQKGIKRLFGLSGYLATGNMVQLLRSTALALPVAAMGVSLLVGLTVLEASFRDSLIGWLSGTFRADLYARSNAPSTLQQSAYLPADFVRSLMSDNRISGVLLQSSLTTRLEGKLITISSVNLDVALKFRAFDLSSGRYARTLTKEVMISESLQRKFGHQIGDSLVLLGERFLIVGTFRDFARERGTAIIDRAFFLKTFSTMPSEALVESVGAYFKKESSGVELYQEIVNKFTEYNLNLNNSRSLKEMVLTIFDNTFAITTVVRILIALIVSAGFLASVLQYIYERRSFYQVCQVMGISINRLLYSLYLEIGMLIIPGLACGIALGVALAVILVKLVNPLSFGWSLKLSLTGAAYVTPVILLLACSLLMVPILFIALRQLTKPPYRSLE